MLQAQLSTQVKKNRFTKAKELGRISFVDVIWWAEPVPAVEVNVGDLTIRLSPAQCRDWAHNLLEAAAKAEAWPNGPQKPATGPERDKLREFVVSVGRLTKDGECATCGKDGNEPNPACNSHEPWDMPNDDAVDTVHSLISEARELLKGTPEPSEYDAYRKAAKRIYDDEGTIEIDDNALVSKGDDDGAYVQAWVWVYDEDAGLNRESED